MKLKFYDVEAAPNPRRVRMFLAEKNLAGAGVEVETVQVDMMAGEHKTPSFLKISPSGKVPALELEDGRTLAESVAICRFIEGLVPEPALFGSDSYELGRVEMANRQLELEMMAAIGKAWVNGKVVAQIFADRIADGSFRQIPEAKEQGDRDARAFYERLDRELADRPYMAGSEFSVADITALCFIDFATQRVDLEPDRSLSHLWRWHARVSERPSATA